MINIIDIAIIIQIFVLVNPLSSLPVLISAYRNKMNTKKIAVNSVVIAFSVALIIALIGPYLFQVFNITLDSFRIAGGIVLLLLGLQTIKGKDEEAKGKVSTLTSIIATPLLTGPATISFVTLKSFEVGRIITITNLTLAFVLVAIVFILFAYSVSKINTKVVNIVSKVLGLFLTAMAIEMIVNGILNVTKAAIA